MMPLPDNKEIHYLHFLLEDTHACVDIRYIHKVLPLTLLENIPGSPHYVTGLMNLAGASIPIIDLAMKIDLQRKTQYSLDTPIILCGDNTHQQLGFIVDKVMGLFVSLATSMQLNQEFSTPTSPFSGTLTLENQVILIIDMPKILTTSVYYQKRGQP